MFAELCVQTAEFAHRALQKFWFFFQLPLLTDLCVKMRLKPDTP